MKTFWVGLFLCVTTLVIACGAIYMYASKGALDSNQQGIQKNFPATASELRALKSKWKDAIVEMGAPNAYAAFLKEAPQLSIDTHAQSHAFGEALYEVEGLPGLKVCDSSFEFGCYHSFFGLAVNAEGIGSLSKFNEACKSKFNNNLPCQHGIGHGVLVYTDYDNLVEALELCETISSLPTGGCSSGVFMEYNFHTMDSSSGNQYIRGKTDDVYAPCNSLPERFQASCYNEQVQWWQNIYNSDFAYIGELCAVLPDGSDIYEACYHGIGNYTAAETQFNYEDIVATCVQMPNINAQALCHEGATWLMNGDKSKKDEAMQLCKVLSSPYDTNCLRKLQY